MSDFKAKMHQIRLLLGLRPDPTGGTYCASPDPLAVFKGPTSKGREGKGERKGRGGKENGKVGEGKGEEGWPPNWGVWMRQCSRVRADNE